MAFRSLALSVAVAMAAAVGLQQSSSAPAFVPLTEHQQDALRGSTGSDTSCTGTANCARCVRHSGCGSMWLGLCWDSDCTTQGSSGCALAAAISVCAPDPDKSCTNTGQPAQGQGANCGGWEEPDSVPKIVAGVWVCQGVCVPNGQDYFYCHDCL